MANNAEHIKQLKSLALSAGNYGMVNAVNAAIHALRNEGHSPWRKVTASAKKKYAGKEVIVAWEDGTINVRCFPDARYANTEWISVYIDRALWFCLLPEHPEKEVK